MSDETTPSVDSVFGTLKRFHIYDHDRNEWVMSGVDFGETAVVNHTLGPGDPERFPAAETLVAGQPSLSLVWEDNDDNEYESELLPDAVASDIVEAAAYAVASRLDVPTETIRVARIRAPGTVDFVRLPSVDVRDAAADADDETDSETDTTGCDSE